MKQMQGIGQLLWKLREKEGIRQKQLCMGISSLSKYARIEADQQEIDFFLIDRIMGRLGKSVERLTYILPMASTIHRTGTCADCVAARRIGRTGL